MMNYYINNRQLETRKLLLLFQMYAWPILYQIMKEEATVHKNSSMRDWVLLLLGESKDPLRDFY
jgi:hypothetical protein